MVPVEVMNGIGKLSFDIVVVAIAEVIASVIPKNAVNGKLAFKSV